VTASSAAQRRRRRHVDTVLVLLSVLTLWQTGHWAAGGTTLAGPMETGARLWLLEQRPAFRADVIDTGAAFLLSALISVVAGVLLGCTLGLGRLLGRVVEPVLASFYALPKVTLYPVVLLLFGLGFSAKVAFGVMHGLVPIVLLTMNAVLQVRPVHLRAARAMRLSRSQTIMTVVLPSILPEVLGGVRIGVPLTLLGVLIGEMFASRRGLGAVAMRAMEANDGPTLLAVAVLLSAAALGVNAGLRWLADKTVGSRPASAAL
jgi:NitT/TauT family transport system permease protein